MPKKIRLAAAALLLGTPTLAGAQEQLYECQYTIVRREITTRYPNGSVSVRYEYTRTEVCRPI
jgi:hypothetical protein